MYNKLIKPPIDIFFAIFAMTLFSPIFILVAIGLALANKGEAFFFQKRPGLHGKIFVIIKFKTMKDALGMDGKLLPDEERLSTIGKIVRKLSIDEIPQLINVIKGEMSLIGPRPLLVDYLDYYSKEQNRRHEVKPGITGWAQVNGRNAISWEDKFKLDVWYVDHQSFLLDLKILFMTIVKVFKAEGISAQNHVTVEKFEGSR